MVKDIQATLRRARWSELLFAIITLYLSSGIPFPPPDGRAVVMAAHWYGMVAVALGLVVALRRPTRAAWAVALGLSAYFLANFLLGLRAWHAVAADADRYSGPAMAVSYAIVGIALLAQLNVAVQCWRTRAIRRRGPATGASAPVA